MASVSELVARIRSHGANVILDAGKLRIVNGKKLPAGALDYIKQHGREIADWLCAEADFEERAAIVEYDGGAPREMAEQFAKVCAAKRPSGWSELDHSWFIGRCARIIDEAAEITRNPDRVAA